MRYILCLYSLILSMTLWAQSDSAIKAIRYNTQTTAENTTKGGFDYLTLTISLLAFFIACITLYYSIKTYRSQKKTESNTTKFSAKQERIELRYLAAQLIYNAYALYFADEQFVENNEYCLNGRIYERMLINTDRLHADVFMGNGIDYSGLYEFSILVNKYNDMLREKQRVAECRVSKTEGKMIGNDYFNSLTYKEMEMTWTLFKHLYRLYNEGMLTDEERKLLTKGVQGAEILKDLTGIYTIDDVLKRFPQYANPAQLCALETDLTYPYRILADAWKKYKEKFQVDNLIKTDSDTEKLLRTMLISDESKEGVALRYYYLTAIHCSIASLQYNFLSEEKVTGDISIITTYVITEEGEFHTYLDSYDFGDLLSGVTNEIEFHISYDCARMMIKDENDLPQYSDQLLGNLSPEQSYRLAHKKLLPLGALVITTNRGGLMHTIRIKALNHSIEFTKKQNEKNDGYLLRCTLDVNTGNIITYDRFPYDEERYRFLQV